MYSGWHTMYGTHSTVALVHLEAAADSDAVPHTNAHTAGGIGAIGGCGLWSGRIGIGSVLHVFARERVCLNGTRCMET